MTGMDRLRDNFAARKREGGKVLIAYLVVGDPNLEASRRYVGALLDAGADIVELGVPFSDPVADGPTIQAAGQRALEHDLALDDIFDLGESVRAEYPNSGLIVMGYANPLFLYGIEAAADRCATAGIDGWIVPDVPLEECARFVEPCRAHGLGFIPLVAPTTPIDRATKIIEYTKPPFVYYVSVTGVTGARKGLPGDWAGPLQGMRAVADAEFVVGFGISSPELAREAAAEADGVVVGSALIDRITEGDSAEAERRLSEFIAGLRNVL